MISFAPLEPDAVRFLSAWTSINFGICDFNQPVWLCATSRDDQRKIDGVFIAEFTTWFEAHWTCVVDNPRIISRRLLRALFTALFSRAVRVTAMTRPDNERAISGILRLGFVFEGGPLRKAIEGKWDALIFSMMKEECRWLRKMSPSLMASNPTDARSIDAISNGDFFLQSNGGSDFQHLSGG